MIQNKLEVISEFLIHLEAWMEYIFIWWKILAGVYGHSPECRSLSVDPKTVLVENVNIKIIKW